MKIKFPYLYETHLHTSQGSKCGAATGKEMAKAAKEYGYTGIFVTDHNWGGNCNVDASLPWSQWVHEFCRGYEDAREWGDVHDLQVFFGYEAGYQGTEFLIYGVDDQWLIAHPEIRDASIEEQYELIHNAGGMVIHAHPYREEWYIPEIRLFPQWVDGVEGINATHSHSQSGAHKDPMYDRRAVAYAQEHDFPMTAGSDIHNTNLFGGGICFRRKLESVQDYINAILGREEYILTNGEKYYRDGMEIQ